MNRAMRIGLVLAVGIGASALVSYLIHQKVLRPAQAREEAFAALRSGELAPGADGVAILPDKWAIASVDGKAYITGSPNRTLWALFLKERGDGAKFKGYLFCNKPAKTGAKAMVDLQYPATPTRGDRHPDGSLITVNVLRVLSPYSFEVMHDKP